MLIELKSLDAALADQAAAQTGRRIEFQQERGLSAAMPSGLFREINDETVAARELFATALTESRGVPLGRIRLENVLMIGANGLMIELEKQTCWLGFASGWPRQMAISTLNRSAFFGTVKEDAVAATDHLTAMLRDGAMDEIGEAYVLSGPGGNIYGHWLLDVSHRLCRLRSAPLDRSATIFKARSGDFVRPFTEAFLNPGYPVIELTEESVYLVKSLVIDTLPRFGQILDQDESLEAWDMLKTGFCGSGKSGPISARLFVSRGGATSRSFLKNGEAVEDHLKNRGWDIITPEELAMSRQIETFAAAHCILGEDGSGLHNTIFADAADSVGVINTGRTNLFHASIASIKGQSIAYLNASPTDQAERVASSLDLDRFDAFLRSLDG